MFHVLKKSIGMLHVPFTMFFQLNNIWNQMQYSF